MTNDASHRDLHEAGGALTVSGNALGLPLQMVNDVTCYKFMTNDASHRDLHEAGGALTVPGNALGQPLQIDSKRCNMLLNHDK
jgi:hypothetical protein